MLFLFPVHQAALMAACVFHYGILPSTSNYGEVILIATAKQSSNLSIISFHIEGITRVPIHYDADPLVPQQFCSMYIHYQQDRARARCQKHGRMGRMSIREAYLSIEVK